MKRLDELITTVRQHTDNVNFGESEGILDDEFVALFNDALTHIYLRILAEVPDTSMFDSTVNIDLVADQRAYGDNETWALGSCVKTVEYSPTGLENDYYFLEPRTLREMSTVGMMYPDSYLDRAGQILISPIPTSAQGNLRVNFVKTPNGLDVRRAKIATASYSALVLDTGEDISDVLTDDGNFPYYVCICSDFGVVSYYNALVTAYDSGTSTLTLSGVSSSLGTISNGDWITYGKYTTTHAAMPKDFQSYLTTYAVVEILKRDSSVDASDWNDKLGQLQADIVAVCKKTIRDRSTIPVSSDFYLM